ncbi:Uncharacterized protein TCM_007804 [Theobroma cacao]|uniref:Uncharacterized protein n=1 Tax=Theobroma cacao TaxID=3641 RepID=A0A061E3N3_THECC|nr:Uncharacterized protein TCM_007804 [Theobroma cacao]
MWLSKNPSQLLPYIFYSINDSSNDGLVATNEKSGASKRSQAEGDLVTVNGIEGDGGELPSYNRERPQTHAKKVQNEANTSGSLLQLLKNKLEHP